MSLEAKSLFRPFAHGKIIGLLTPLGGWSAMGGPGSRSLDRDIRPRPWQVVPAQATSAPPRGARGAPSLTQVTRRHTPPAPGPQTGVMLALDEDTVSLHLDPPGRDDHPAAPPAHTQPLPALTPTGTHARAKTDAGPPASHMDDIDEFIALADDCDVSILESWDEDTSDDCTDSEMRVVRTTPVPDPAEVVFELFSLSA